LRTFPSPFFLTARTDILELMNLPRDVSVIRSPREPASDISLQDGSIRRHIVLTGILQGIGCRPTVYRLATGLGLAGWVLNTTSCVVIEIEGTAEGCERFVEELPAAIPFPGRIDTWTVQSIVPTGERGFSIQASREGERSVTPIPPDVATCDACVAELFDPANPRYLYPFITCTLCGPRFTVVRAFPYDRERTSMADFRMCSRCVDEYESAHERRFHSQTNSCAQCGPRLALTDTKGEPLPGDPIIESIRLLMDGGILAVKGIGGFHLACDALNDQAVKLLRDRKGRAEKPFAVMMRDRATAKKYCDIGDREERLLRSPIAPIVLLNAAGERTAPSVAPFMGSLGVMLPYTPVHHLLFGHPGVAPERRPRVLVMTSGNRSEEPIVRGNEEALERIADLVDAFLMHDREIVLRADDSIFRIIAGRATVFRRSRGLVPGEFSITTPSEEPTSQSTSGDEKTGSPETTEPVVLGTGGDLKNALAIIKGNQVVPGPHVGDLASPVAQEYFRQSIDVLSGYLNVTPDLVAVDPHPEYFSNHLSRGLCLPVEEVYHHHAHAASLLFQHDLPGPALFAVFDGTGFGPDGTIWGGEFLVADVRGFTRVGHIGLFPLPGGEAAIRRPARILVGLLSKIPERPLSDEILTLVGEDRRKVALWLEAVRKGIHSPLTSSAGRLFDAAAAAIGFRREVTFEGEAAMWLEGIADLSECGSYPVRLLEASPVVVDGAALIWEVVHDILSGSAPQKVAARFHQSVADTIGSVMELLARQTGIATVGLTGGCFQNRLLTERVVPLLEEKGFNVLLHGSVSPNDGGIALGQALVARSRWRSSCRGRTRTPVE
jgi:hydrogenase maturation protein HypF